MSKSKNKPHKREASLKVGSDSLLENKFSAVILAAGESSRFWPLAFQHKSLIKIMGKPLIFYLIKNLEKLGIKKIIIVQSPKRDIERELNTFSFQNIKFVIQERPLGTGDALLKTERFLETPKFFLLNAERIDIGEFLEDLLVKEQEDNLVILGGPTKQFHLFGILKVKGDKVLDIIEKPKKEQAPSNLRNIGFYLLPRKFFHYLKRVPPHPYSLIQAIVLYAKKKEVKLAFTEKNPLFLKFPWDLFQMRQYLFDNFLENKKGKGGEISRGARIEGRVQIGKKVKIAEAKIQGPCYLGDNTIIGKNSLIERHSNLENNVYVDNFVEIKNSIFQDNAKIHRSLIEYSIVGPNCEIGAGTVFASSRFDQKPIKTVVKGKKVSTGLKFFGAVIGKGTKIGVNSSLMPGVMIGNNCIIGPQSFVKENLQDNKIFYFQFKNLMKNWQPEA